MGHTDAIGTDAYNLDLSRRRAEAVMRESVARGVSSGQLSQVAIGKRQPIASNDTAEGRALNRRVENQRQGAVPATCDDFSSHPHSAPTLPLSSSE